MHLARLTSTCLLGLRNLQDGRSPIPTDSFVEFIGTVVDGNTIRQESSCNFGNSFDMAMHAECINLMNTRYSSLFA